MKSLFVILIASSAVLFSCKNDSDKTADTKTDSIASKDGATTTTTTTTTTSTDASVPTFSDADVTAYVKAYEDYIAAYKTAAETKDMTKMAELGKTSQELATKSQAAMQKIANNPEEAKKLTDYMTAKSKEVAELAQKMGGK